MNIEEALDTQQEICDAFDSLLLGDYDAQMFADAFTNGGEQAMHVLAEAARLVANLQLEGVRDAYLASPVVARFMDKTGFVAFLPPGATNE